MEHRTALFSQADLDTVVEEMTRRDVEFAPGVSQKELEALETSYSIKFPPDLAEFLKHAVPVGECFPAWRGPEQDVREGMRWPLDGLLADVELTDFWAPFWGDRPNDIGDALRVVTQHFDSAPTRGCPIVRRK